MFPFASAPPRSRVPAILLALTALSLVTFGAPVVAHATLSSETGHGSAADSTTGATGAMSRAHGDPRKRRGLFVDWLMPAAQAGSEFNAIGKAGQALWITDYYSTSSVRSAVHDYAQRANEANKTPMMSIYAIPDRDCGLYSAGGLPDGPTYRRWIREVAAGMKGTHPIVVLEPDAVAFMGDPRCTNAGPRQRLLTYAAKRLAHTGAWVYLDAGHSGWRSAEVMAPLLKASGIRYARGFSTNVGNFRQTSDELGYARRLARELASRGLKNKHFIIETARNGARPGPPNGDVCNPTAARLGKLPKLVFQGWLDGYLWIKHPGESDGPCNGGPSSGIWWPDGARLLLGQH